MTVMVLQVEHEANIQSNPKRFPVSPSPFQPPVGKSSHKILANLGICTGTEASPSG